MQKQSSPNPLKFLLFCLLAAILILGLLAKPVNVQAGSEQWLPFGADIECDFP